MGFFREHNVLFTEDLTDFSNDFMYECWRPYADSISKVYVKEINGILHRVFPSEKDYLPGIGTRYKSNILVKMLEKSFNN